MTQYLLLFIILIGISILIALLYRKDKIHFATKELDKDIKFSKKILELMQIRFEIENSNYEQQRTIEYQRELEKYKILNLQSQYESNQNATQINYFMLQFSLEERKEQIKRLAVELEHRMKLEDKKVDNEMQNNYWNYQARMAEISGMQAKVLRLEEMELEAKKVELDIAKINIESAKYELEANQYKSKFENEKYSQERERAAKESEMFALQRSIEAMMADSKFKTQYAELLKDENEKKKIDELMEETKKRTNDIFSKLNTIQI